MIIFIGPRRQTHILRHMRRDERMPNWQCHSYLWLYRTRRLPAATYIFVAVDRLDSSERRLAGQFYRHINGLGPGWRALNDPSTAMGRYRFLRSMHDAGLNDFNVYLVVEGVKPASFPVFIRRNSSNTPPATGLLKTQAELDKQIDRLVGEGEVPEDLIITEYCGEEFEPGVFRKQAEFRVVDRFIPRPTMYAGNWIAKLASQIDVPDHWLDFDTDLMARNPFEEAARKAFEIAGIEYGRADFGIVNGRPQFYEINFNPSLSSVRESGDRNEIRRLLWERSDTQFFEALSAINGKVAGSQKSFSTPELQAFRLRFWRNYAPQRR